MRPLEATYLAWIDLRAYGHATRPPSRSARGRVRVAPGHDYQPGLDGPRPAQHRDLRRSGWTEIVHRLASALTCRRLLEFSP